MHTDVSEYTRICLCFCLHRQGDLLHLTLSRSKRCVLNDNNFSLSSERRRQEGPDFSRLLFPSITLLSEQICPISHFLFHHFAQMPLHQCEHVCDVHYGWTLDVSWDITAYVSCTVLPHDCTFRSFKLFTGNEATAHDRDAKWRQMVDGSWPLTLVIRYGRCNWPAVFSINRHYSPLCWPAPLVALLFLEAPGSSRVSVLALL